MEGEQREAFAVPMRKKIDQRAARQPFLDAPTDDLGDAGAGDAFFQHGLGIGEGQRAAGLNPDDLLAADKLPIERPSRIGIEKLQAAMAGDIRGMPGFAVSLEIARRSQSEDRRRDQLARDQRREARLPEADGEIDAFRYQIADMLAGHELDREFGITFAEDAEPAGQYQRQQEG